MRTASGQASVEFVALLGLIVAGVAGTVQVALVGHAAWAAGQAAAAAARADAVGADARSAAARALPAHLEHGLRVRTLHGGRVEVGVRVPGVVPGLGVGAVRGRAGFGSQR